MTPTVRPRRAAVAAFILGLLAADSGWFGSSHVTLGREPADGLIGSIETLLSFAAIWLLGASLLFVVLVIAALVMDDTGSQHSTHRS